MLCERELVIFDCDGVLVDSEPVTMSVLAEMIEGLSAADAYHRFRGRRIKSCLLEIEAEIGKRLPAEFEEQFRQRCAARYPEDLQSDPILRQIVDRLDGRYCVATSAPRHKVQIMLEAIGVWDLFHDRVFSAYEIGVWKPDPALFLHAAAAWGVTPENCVVIEDSPAGVAGALAAGMQTFVHDPRHEAHGPDFCGTVRFDRMSQLPELLRQWQLSRGMAAPSRHLTSAL